MSSLAALLLVGAQASAATAPEPPVLSFSLRADLSVAAEVNAALDAVARPVRSRVAASQDPASTISQRCGDVAAPAILSTTPDPQRGSTIVEHKPCLLYRKSRDFTVKSGNTIEQLAIATGLRPSSLDAARVQKTGSDEWKRADTATLSIGDKVRFSKVPNWTRIEVDAAAVPDRQALMKAIADRLNCPGEQPEACLRRRHIDIANADATATTERGTRVQRISRESVDRASTMIARDVTAQPITSRVTVDRATAASPGADARAPSISIPVVGAAPPAPPPSPPPPPPPPAATATLADTAAPAPTAAPPAAAAPAVATVATTAALAITDEVRRTAPVAADQWPYDRALIARILAEDQPHAQPVVVGVADAGLADAKGLPLPPAIFFKNAEERDPEPDQVDDDDNLYVDDIGGAGVLRAGDLEASGDLGVCSSSGTVASLTGASRETADHGAMVASIATGWDIRRNSSADRGLPRLVFFRLLDDVCKESPQLTVTEADLYAAMDYIYERAPILVLSYTLTGTLSSAFRPTVQEHLANVDNLLIIPAGNDTPGDLDANQRCPACLADPNLTDRITVMRTLVVGTAQRDLTIAPVSNWGHRIVHFYAPGETSSAVGIDGNSASAYPPATSWSAPYVGLAAGLMRSLGVANIRDLRERMLGASWPVLAPSDRVDASTSGVVNITAAAAVRHHAIDVVQPVAAGGFERRTYVGRLETSLSELCPEAGLGAVHAIRFGALVDGRREVTARTKTFDSQLKKFRTRSVQCSVPAQITFTDVLRGTQTFDSEAVTQLLVPWL